MVDKLSQMPGKSTVQDLPLTAAMRAAIEQQRAKKLGQRWIIAAILAVLAILSIALLATIGRTSRDSALVVLGFILIVGAIVGRAAWVAIMGTPRKLAKALGEGMYSRYTGWFVVRRGHSKSTSHTLELVHTSLSVPFDDSSPFFRQSPNTDDPWWVAIDYVQGTDMVLAIWHGEFKLLHRHPFYDPESDPEWERPVLEAPAKPAWARQR